MSPEQATGDRVIDGRTDVYSLAAVLYEMLVGDPPHMGSTTQAIIARVLTDRPQPPRVSRESVPEHVDAAVMHGLSKLPADRFATAGEFAEALTGARVLPRTHFMGAAVSSSLPKRRARLESVLAGSALVLGGLLVGAVALRPRADESMLVPMEVELAFPAGTEVLRPNGSIRGSPALAISRDGSQIVYRHSVMGELYLRTMKDPEPRAIRGTEGAYYASFSPDGLWLLFNVRPRPGGVLMKVPVAGGTPITVADNALSASWGDQGEIVFERPFGGLWRVPAEGGAATLLARPDSARGQVSFRWVSLLPGGKAAIVTVDKAEPGSTIGGRRGPGRGEPLGRGGAGRRGAGPGSALRVAGEETRPESQLAVVRMSDGRVTERGVIGDRFIYASSGHLLFSRGDGPVFAMPFSLRSLEPTGPAVQLLENVSTGSGPELAVSDNGTIAYLNRVAAEEGTQLLAVDRRGSARVVAPDLGFFFSPRVSPDGQAIAFERWPSSTAAGGGDIWTLNISSGAMSRLTTSGMTSRPAWSKDGRRLAYIRRDSANLSVVEWQAWDRSGAPEALLETVSGVGEVSLGPRPGYVVTRQDSGPGGLRGLVIAHWDSLDAPRRLVAESEDHVMPAVSPDGKLVAFMTRETGRYEVYVRALPGPGGRLQVSTNNGRDPMWVPGSRELVYRTGTHYLSATLADGPTLSVASRDTLFEDRFAGPASLSAPYDVFPGGEELLMLKAPSAATEPGRLTLLMNWNQELKRRAPPR
jgi:serine/threonine-protein kinase